VQRAPATSGLGAELLDEDDAASVLAAAGGASNVEGIIWHVSDSAVKPIVANRRIERLPEPRYEPKGLPFTPLSLQVGCSGEAA
jgi:serine/threonine-protein kinase ULK4